MRSAAATMQRHNGRGERRAGHGDFVVLHDYEARDYIDSDAVSASDKVGDFRSTTGPACGAAA